MLGAPTALDGVHPSRSKMRHTCHMIDNIFQIGTAAEAQRAGTAQDSGILFADFASAYPSVDHQRIMAGL